jgi:hypothetical protein
MSFKILKPIHEVFNGEEDWAEVYCDICLRPVREHEWFKGTIIADGVYRNSLCIRCFQDTQEAERKRQQNRDRALKRKMK